MQHVVLSLVVVIADVNNVAVCRICRERDVAASALRAEESVEIEPGALNDANSCLAVVRIDQIHKQFRATATFIVTHHHDVSDTCSCPVIKSSPGMVNCVSRSVWVNRWAHGRAILTR